MTTPRHLPFTDLSGLQLEPGRYRATFDEIETVWGFNAHRRTLLDELRQFTVVVQRIVPVAVIWVSGSYFTDKPNPSDMDITLHIDAEKIEALPARNRPLVTADGLRLLAQHLGLRIDAYLVPWVSGTGPNHTPAQIAQYQQGRGYWDDWWLRLRGGSSKDESTPRRGYVEVMVDGY